jgi:coenzyme F420-reducing hydrogenase beta subunit
MPTWVNGKQHLVLPVVDGFLCCECGICTATCPVSAINAPDLSDEAFIAQVKEFVYEEGLNAARAASWCSAPGSVSNPRSRGRIGTVLHPCELRALVDLVKLQQANLDDIVTIGVDCLGTCDVSVYTEMQANGRVDMATLLSTAQDGERFTQAGYVFRFNEEEWAEIGEE